MLAFLAWYLLITLLGWLTFPLAYRLFPALADRGYTLSRAFGLLIWGYVFWLSASLGLAQNDVGGLLLGLVVLGGLSVWATGDRRSEIVTWISENRRLLLTTEILFLVTFGFMAVVRAANPEIVGTEKPMELMMINGILNSPTFPPRDLWLSGYSISYYYFGYVMTSMLALLTGTPATMAFNLMIALVFGLAAVGAYGVVYNLLALGRTSQVESVALSSSKGQTSKVKDGPAVFAPLLGPLFLLFVSNLEGFLEILHGRGWFWREGANLWTWLDIMDLREAPSQILSWGPDRFWWWWRASRVIMDYDLNGNWTLDVISEFPAFSFVLGDLHPHVLAMPFVLLMIAFALNLFLGGWRGNIDLYFAQLHLSKTGFFLVALMLGGLAFLNTWDILIGGALIVFSYALFRVRESGWGWERLEDILLLALPAGLTAYLLYLPFFIGFDSQAGGIVPNFMFPTRGAQLWVMWGALFLILFPYLVYSARTGANWRAGIFSALGVTVLLLAAMFVLGFAGLKLRPDLVEPLIAAQGRTVDVFIADSMARRLSHLGGTLTVLALLIPALALLFRNYEQPVETGDEYLKAESSSDTESTLTVGHQSSTVFALLLITLGTLLILGPEFLYLRDNFGFRINTIFKFYYQAWIVLSVAAAYGTVTLLRALRGAGHVAFTLLLVFVLLAGLAYPVLAFPTKTNNFNPPNGFSLDDFDRVQRDNPDEAAAIEWLRAAPDGILVEATRDAYSAYGRISIYTGLPTVLGWSNHEGQWRDYALQGSRNTDIETLYSTPDWATAQSILDRYDIRYVYIGNLERLTYRVEEQKFADFLRPVFLQGNVSIYEVP